MSAPPRTTAIVVAASVLLGPSCGHRGDPLPPLRHTPPGLSEFRFAQRGAGLEVSLLAPAASVDGIPYERLAVEVLYAEGEKDIERGGLRRERLAYPRQRVVETLALPQAGTVARAAARAVYGREKGPRTLTLALVAQDVVAAPGELRARLEAGGVTLEWSGAAPAAVDAAVKPPRLPLPFQSGTAAPPSGAAPTAAPGGSPSRPSESAKPEGPPAAAVPAGAQAPGPARAPGQPAAPAADAPADTPVKTSVSPAPTRTSGFFVYRRVGNEPYAQPLGPEPLAESGAHDIAAPMGATACYVVRAVASAEPLVESAASNEACVEVRDVAAPAAPTGVAVLPRDRGLEVLWSPSPEADLASYRVYREAAGEARTRVAEVPAGRASWLDASARPGVAYQYAVSAVDASGNESPPGGPAEGSLP